DSQLAWRVPGTLEACRKHRSARFRLGNSGACAVLLADRVAGRQAAPAEGQGRSASARNGPGRKRGQRLTDLTAAPRAAGRQQTGASPRLLIRNVNSKNVRPERSET